MRGSLFKEIYFTGRVPRNQHSEIFWIKGGMGSFQGGAGESRVVGNVFQMGRGEDGDWHQGAGERGADWHQGAGEG